MAGFFVELVEMTFSSTKKMPAQTKSDTEPRVLTRLAFQPRSDRAMDDPRTETKLICVPRDRTAIIA